LNRDEWKISMGKFITEGELPPKMEEQAKTDFCRKFGFGENTNNLSKTEIEESNRLRGST